MPIIHIAHPRHRSNHHAQSCNYDYTITLMEKEKLSPFWELESPLPKDTLCKIWLKLANRFWRRFLNFVNVFSPFRYHLSLEKVWLYIWTDLNLLYPRMLCDVCMVEIVPVVLEKKLEFHLPKDDLRQVWLKMVYRFWRKQRFLKLVNVSFCIMYYVIIYP